jgi:hypothetical protein
MVYKRIKSVVISPELIITFKGTKKYKLSSMIYHAGDSPSSGHYIAAVNYFDVWYILDDYTIDYRQLQTLIKGETEHYQQQQKAEQEEDGDESGPDDTEYSRYKKEDSTPIPTSDWYAGIPLRDGGKLYKNGSSFYIYMLGYTALDADSKEEKELLKQQQRTSKQQEGGRAGDSEEEDQRNKGKSSNKKQKTTKK